jgi:hypothetical protein
VLHEPFELVRGARSAGLLSTPMQAATAAGRKNGNTACRRKCFSLPTVTTRTTSGMTTSDAVSGGEPERWSFVLDNLRANGSESQSKFMQGVTAGKLSKLPAGQAALKFDDDLSELAVQRQRTNGRPCICYYFYLRTRI